VLPSTHHITHPDDNSNIASPGTPFLWLGPKIAEHSGRVVKITGDELLAEFPSVVDAVRCICMAAYRATGARFQSTYHLVLLAQALAACGGHDEGLAAWREATDLAAKTGERYVEAEIHRVEGNLLLAKNDRAAAEACYERALDERGRNRRARPNCAAPATWQGCGPSPASGRRCQMCWRRSTAGSPRASRPPT
jgi:hypothetical protein